MRATPSRLATSRSVKRRPSERRLFFALELLQRLVQTVALLVRDLLLLLGRPAAVHLPQHVPERPAPDARAGDGAAPRARPPSGPLRRGPPLRAVARQHPVDDRGGAEPLLRERLQRVAQ